MDIIRQEQPKASKKHTCMWCGGEIEKGERYYKTVIKNEYIYTWINHIKCSTLYDKLEMYNHDDGYGVDSDSFMQLVYEFLYSKLDEEEHDGLFGEEAVDKVIEILKSEGK